MPIILPTLDYEPRPPKNELSAKFVVAYLLVCAPCVFGFLPTPNPVPLRQAQLAQITVSVAICAAVFIVLRRRTDPVGWAGLAVWGGLFMFKVISELLGRAF